nr:hypothetical protein CTI12_AA158720 [Tanacetum cinerariifolium]
MMVVLVSLLPSKLVDTVRVLTSWTPTNPARRFIVCQNQNKPNAKKKCKLWDWFDKELESDCVGNEVVLVRWDGSSSAG